MALKMKRGEFVAVPLVGGGATFPTLVTHGLDLTALEPNIRKQQRWVLKIKGVAAGAFEAAAHFVVYDGTDWGYMGVGDGDVNGQMLLDDTTSRAWFFGFEDLAAFDLCSVFFTDQVGSPTWTVSLAPLLKIEG